MDTFAACLAFGPLAIYLLLLGSINLAARPLVITGTREMLALGLAVVGLAIVGPMQLFMPDEAANAFGPWVWLLLVCFYALGLAMLIMLAPPKLVIYNVDREALESVLPAVATQLDPESVWTAETLNMPLVRIRLRVEHFAPLRNVTLVASGYEQSPTSWSRLAAALRRALAGAPRAARSHGGWMVLAGGLILLMLSIRVASDPQTVAQGLARMLNP